jgi:cell division protein FtsI/penicillin-binding protein 2
MKLRLAFFLIIQFLMIVIWAAYLFSVQMLDPHGLESIVKKRQNYSKQIITPVRGELLDRNRNVLVSSVKLYQIDIDRNAIIQFCKRNPQKSITVNDMYEKIGAIISKNSSLSQSSIVKKLHSSSSAGSIYITDDIYEGQMNIIQNLFDESKIPGLVRSFSGIRRNYPKDKLAASLLGMVSPSDKNANESGTESIYNIRGVSGFEATFESELAGRYGWREEVNDAKNEKIPLNNLKEHKPQNGNSIVLTIDSNLQEILELNLSNGLEKYKAKHGIGVIMEPYTGEILAMAGVSHDDKYKSAAAMRSLQNMPVSFMFEPGSVMKPITALLAIENNIYQMDTQIDCRDYRMENRIIKDSHEHRTLNFKDVIAYSSNVGISRIVEKIGSKKLYDRYIEMGFGHKTGSNIAGESSGIFRKLKDWQGFSLHSISFGQEISVTALQLAVAYSALANGGKVMKPLVHKEIIDENGKIVSVNKPQKIRTISDPKSLEKLKEMLQATVDYGTATGTKFENLTVAGKTGTAEKSKVGGGGYSEDKYTAVFTGFFPVEKPKYVMIVVFDEPTYTNYYYYASLSAVPTFKSIIRNMMNLPSSDLLIDIAEKENQFVEMPNVTGFHKAQAFVLLKERGINFSIINHTKQDTILDQFPKPKVRFDKQQTAILVFDKHEEKKQIQEKQFVMPDFTGLTLKKAIEKATKNKIKLIIEGNGIVASQSIPKGKKIEFGETCYVTAR